MFSVLTVEMVSQRVFVCQNIKVHPKKIKEDSKFKKSINVECTRFGTKESRNKMERQVADGEIQ